MSPSANIDFANVAVLEQDASPSSLLSRLHPLRMAYILEQWQRNVKGATLPKERPLSGVRVLDVGCGRGLIAASLARLGADATAIDVSADTLTRARNYAQFHGLAIDYRKQTIEELASESQDHRYDMVIHCEVIEHIPEPRSFMRACLQVTKAGGLQILSTPNRSWASYLVMIVLAEQGVGWLAQGSHDWQRFITPTEMRALVRECSAQLGVNAQVVDERGVTFDIMRRQFRLSDDKQVNYFMTLKL
ncbi:MAG: 3-demethylubiquinone-9 3-O-methyltransferase [Alphaproteobacteria bacterium GM202ARS2]|nr:3-demethylubiquinone-9 3-O-methyltransferase [Alphaproteobacteria bacterium GM202ARS2]